jgi:uncharacterized protein (TIGR03083 family)
MESSRLLACLGDDYGRLRAAAARDLSAPVPTCPGWTVTDLVYHVAEVYLHKVEAMRQQQFPEPWPPDLSGEAPVAALDRAYDQLTREFAVRAPDSPAWTFYSPEPTVGFWIRRMAQETVIHRVDAELALGLPVAPIPDDLAVDGVDEVLVIFLGYGSRRWPGAFEADLKGTTGAPVRVATRDGGGRWLVRAAPDAVTVDTDAGRDTDAGGATSPVAEVSGGADPLLRWLWGRAGDDAVEESGDREALVKLRQLLVAATQ